MYTIKYTKLATEHIEMVKYTLYGVKLKKIIDDIKEDPFQSPPFYKTIKIKNKEFHIRKIFIFYSLVYEIRRKEKELIILDIRPSKNY